MTRSLPSPELLRQILRYEPETGRLFWRARPVEMFKTAHHAKTWNTRYSGREAFTAVTGRGYRHGSIFGVSHNAQRVIWAMETGEWPEGDVDHERGDTADNRFAKLRDVTHAENQRNLCRARNNTSGVTGVCWDKAPGKWRAEIGVAGRQRTLGRFLNFAAAVAARKAAEAEHGFHENHGRSK